MHDSADERPLDEIEAALAEILIAADAGEGRPEDLVERYPEHQEALRRRLARLHAFDAEHEEIAPVHVPGYIVDRLLGQGGMGQVWNARRQSDGAVVAIKTLHRSAAGPNMVKRFRREGEALARLDHPHIVRVEDVGETEHFSYIVMEKLSGRDLGVVVTEEHPEVFQVVAWAASLADALVDAHEIGIVHRDVKPSNILVTDEGRAVLIDFGLTRGVEKSSLSMTGQFIGSPHYAAPEQIRGQDGDVGPLSDVYSLGASLYEALTGRPPFDASTIQDLFRRILVDEPTDVERLNPRVPRNLALVIRRAMEKKPAHRYPDAAAFRDDLQAVLEGRDVVAGPPGWRRRTLRWGRRHPAASAALLAVLVLVVGVAVRDEVRRRDAAARRAVAASKLIADARARLATFERDAEELPNTIIEFEKVRRQFFASPPDAALRDRFEALKSRVESAETELELVSLEILETLRAAEELDGRVEGADALRARLFFQRWRLAAGRSDDRMMAFFARRVLDLDGPDGRWGRAVRPRIPISVNIDPPGARVDAFVHRNLRDVADTKDSRIIALPFRGLPEGVKPGALALRVMRPEKGIMPEDLVVALEGAPLEGAVFVLDSTKPGIARGARLLEIDGAPVPEVGVAEDLLAEPGPHSCLVMEEGRRSTFELSVGEVVLGNAREFLAAGGGSVTLWRDGRLLSRHLPPGAVLRPSRSPLLHGPQSFLGTAPLENVAVPGDAVVLLIRADGYLPMRILLDARNLPDRLPDVRLDPSDAWPDAFVSLFTTDYRRLRIMDREVTVGEYMEFLRADDAVAGLPLSARLPQPGAEWLAADGTARRPPGVRPDLPIVQVTWKQATAYAAWRTRRARERGQPWRFTLPSSRDWQTATGWVLPRWRYPWGRDFRPTFCKSCFARQKPRIEPVLRFPIDETARGLLDTAGGVAEFASSWFWEERLQRAVHGGSWAHAEPQGFESRSTFGLGENESHGFVGFRLVLHIDE